MRKVFPLLGCGFYSFYILLAGCNTWGSKMAMGDQHYAPVRSEHVVIFFEKPARPYMEIGLVSSLGGWFASDGDNYHKMQMAAAALEADAKAAGLDATQRLELRRQKAQPIVEALKGRVESARTSALPRSALGKACDYSLGCWGQLRRFLDYGEIELSNNLAENAIWPVAIGRRNWLHVGSERAGPRVAAILSVIETCRRHQIPIRQYLGSVLPGLAELPARRVSELTPANWARSRS